MIKDFKKHTTEHIETSEMQIKEKQNMLISLKNKQSTLDSLHPTTSKILELAYEISRSYINGMLNIKQIKEFDDLVRTQLFQQDMHSFLTEPTKGEPNEHSNDPR